LFLFAITGQALTGYQEYLADLMDENAEPITFINYLKSGHFFQVTFENWESEFLQMALFIWFTVFLRQKGSSESKQIEGEDKTDKEPDPKRKGAPWPVRKGGFMLKLYENSLTITFLILFILSWLLHFYGSLRDENIFRKLRGEPLVDIMHHLTNSRFWFESFQNWQSEFLSVFAIVVLSIFLRQKGSSQSKQVDSPYYKTGE
jgi:magnesium-transporting ATPase (P-type)